LKIGQPLNTSKEMPIVLIKCATLPFLDKFWIPGFPKTIYISTKMNLDNYDSLADSRKHVQNVRSSSELVNEESDVICKILSTTFKRSAYPID
jgi:hypothetical protein